MSLILPEAPVLTQDAAFVAAVQDSAVVGICCGAFEDQSQWAREALEKARANPDRTVYYIREARDHARKAREEIQTAKRWANFGTAA